MLKILATLAFVPVAVLLVVSCLRPSAGSKIGTRVRLLCLGALCVGAGWLWFAEPSEIRELRRMPLLDCGDRTFAELADGFLEDARWKLDNRNDVLTVTGTVRSDAAGIPEHPPLWARFVVELDYCGAIEGYWEHAVSPWDPPLFDSSGSGEFTAVESAKDARLLGYERFLAGFCPKTAPVAP